MEIWNNKVLIYGSISITIEENMKCWTTLCLEHNHGHEINYLQKHTKKHTVSKDTLDQVERN